MDTVSRDVRSRTMRAVRSADNRSTERRLRAYLIGAGLRGWTLHPRDIEGSPDFVFRARKVAVFVDGCFWHGCPRCCRYPKSNADYWKNKIGRNMRRDRRVARHLRAAGWKVLRVWEHDVAERPGVVLSRIGRAVQGAR